MTSPTRTDRSRNLILEAAHSAFLKAGLDQTSMEDIANSAGLTRKTLYNHFASKEDIAYALIAAVEADQAGYRARMARGDNAIDLIEHVLVQSAHWCIANPALARLALSPASRPTLAPPADRPSFQGLMRDLVVLGQQQSLIRSDRDAGFMALVLLAVYGQAMLTVLSGASFSEPDIRNLVQIIVQGIGRQER